jgi:hypothetical protein
VPFTLDAAAGDGCFNSQGLGVSWEQAAALAQGELTLGAASSSRWPRLSSGPATERENFPVWVVKTGGDSLWLLGEIETYRNRKRAWAAVVPGVRGGYDNSFIRLASVVRSSNL